MNRLPNKNLLFLTLSLLTVSLACSTAQTLVDGTPTPAPTATAMQTQPPTSTPTLTAIPTLDWTPIPCTGDDCIDACLSRVEELMQVSPFQNEESGFYDTSAMFDLAAYPVDGEELGEMEDLWVPKDYRAFKEDQAAHLRIWNYFISVIPADVRKRVDRLIIFTDGPLNKLAYVKPTNDDSQNWTIAFDIADADYPPYLTETLVHEVGHLITLDAEQVAFGDNNPLTCDNFLLYEGCSSEDSYINQFYQRYWPDITKEWSLIDNAKDGGEYYVMIQNFYRRHSYEFVSTYAVTNPAEDIAESWMTFVLNPQPDDNNIADEKVLFFYDYPELVKYRQQIIDGICSYVQ